MQLRTSTQELLLKKCVLLNRKSQQVFICLTVSYLKALVLKHLLDGHPLLTVNEARLIHHAKRAITDHLDIGVGHLLRAIRALAWGGNHCGHLPTVSYNTFETLDLIRSDCSLGVNRQISTRKCWSGMMFLQQVHSYSNAFL